MQHIARYYQGESEREHGTHVDYDLSYLPSDVSRDDEIEYVF